MAKRMIERNSDFGHSEVFCQPMEGALDEIRFYNGPLSAQNSGYS
jgi:hypothetical protein